MAQKDLTPYQIERELLRLKNALGKAREKLNQRAEDYLKATREYKKEFAKTFVAAKIQGNKTVALAERCCTIVKIAGYTTRHLLKTNTKQESALRTGILTVGK